jgi:GNAT superfamily N-acetyltransferase
MTRRRSLIFWLASVCGGKIVASHALLGLGHIVRIWEHRFETLTDGKEPTGDGPAYPVPPQPFVSTAVVPITNSPRFATAPLEGDGTFAHQVLLELKNNEWVCVGSYVDDTIYLEPEVRGRGLAEELLLRSAEHRTLPLTTNFTHSGYSLLRRTHRLAVARAVKVGLHVPQEVLADYADPHN